MFRRLLHLFGVHDWSEYKEQLGRWDDGTYETYEARWCLICSKEDTGDMIAESVDITKEASDA